MHFLDKMRIFQPAMLVYRSVFCSLLPASCKEQTLQILVGLQLHLSSLKERYEFLIGENAQKNRNQTIAVSCQIFHQESQH